MHFSDTNWYMLMYIHFIQPDQSVITLRNRRKMKEEERNSEEEENEDVP